MMADYGTFSSLVDDCVKLTGRPNLSNEIINYARLTIRECQTKIFSDYDMVEDALIVDAEPFIWEKPRYFRSIEAVEYAGILDDRNHPIRPRHIQPGERDAGNVYYYYSSSGAVIFSGVGIGQTINFAYYVWSKTFPYTKSELARPATYNLETEAWSYSTATTTEAQLLARQSVTNWLLFDWYGLILEGTCAKVWKSVNDPRALSSFAMYKSLQTEMADSIAVDSTTGA